MEKLLIELEDSIGKVKNCKKRVENIKFLEILLAPQEAAFDQVPKEKGLCNSCSKSTERIYSPQKLEIRA